MGVGGGMNKAYQDPFDGRNLMQESKATVTLESFHVIITRPDILLFASTLDSKM